MSTPKREIGDLLLEALETALEREGECRLMPKGARAKGLLPAGRLTAARKQTLEQCLDRELGLFSVREVEEGEGTSTTKAYFVTITPRGIEFLFARRTPAERQELLSKCANPHKEIAHDAWLRVTADELNRITSERELLDKRAAELRKLIKEVVEEQFAALDRARKDLERQRDELQGVAHPIPEPGGPERPGKKTGDRPIGPVTDGDIDFQRDLCRELVFAWQDNSEPEARAALEVVMGNAGLERFGETGETVSFDNREHHAASDLLPGQPAVVLEPGWQLKSPRGTLLIAPMQVTAAGHPGEVGHASNA